jgi:hypothetical protein
VFIGAARPVKIITKVAAKGAANFANPLPCHEPAVQSSARPSIFRHGLSRRDGTLESTNFIIRLKYSS